MSLSWITQWVLKSLTSILIRRRRAEAQTHRRGESHVKTETEMGVMQPQAKESLDMLETGRSKERFSPRTFTGSVPC